MQEESSAITEKVRQFYAECPFNGYSNPETAAANIKELNQVAAVYPDLDALLMQNKKTRFADCGCGPGWLSSTVAFYYPKTSVTAYDLNPRALELAQKTAAVLKLRSVSWNELNLFDAKKLTDRFDIVTSLGVLHHTPDCKEAFTSISRLADSTKTSYLYIGLYHLYGRRPFLAHFAKMQKEGYSEEALFEEYKKLHSTISDTTHLYSWFRDQVLHPHETQHTLKEVVDWVNEIGFTVQSTSINRFQKITNLEDLFEQEKGLEEISKQRNFVERRYFPGFFTFCAVRPGVS